MTEHYDNLPIADIDGQRILFSQHSIVRHYVNEINFSRESIDLFFNLVEHLYNLVYIRRINPYTREPYMPFPIHISGCFRPDVSTNTNTYKFSIAFSVNQSLLPPVAQYAIRPALGEFNVKGELVLVN
jgi:hypothetical protein